MQEKLYLGNKFYDPRVSRIHKIMSKICPKFLDLYASIYGIFILKTYKFLFVRKN